MSGNYEYSDIFDDNGREEQQSGSGLRKQLEDALAANKKLAERLDKLEQGSTTDLLKEKGINPQVAELIPDGANPNEWLEKYGSLFGKPANESAEPEVEVHDEALEEERAALEQVNQSSADTGIPSTATADQVEKLKSFETEAELLAYIQSGGVET